MGYDKENGMGWGVDMKVGEGHVEECLGWLWVDIIKTVCTFGTPQIPTELWVRIRSPQYTDTFSSELPRETTGHCHHCPIVASRQHWDQQVLYFLGSWDSGTHFAGLKTFVNLARIQQFSPFTDFTSVVGHGRNTAPDLRLYYKVGWERLTDADLFLFTMPSSRNGQKAFPSSLCGSPRQYVLRDEPLPGVLSTQRVCHTNRGKHWAFGTHTAFRGSLSTAIFFFFF